jgi:hypothetical protein
MATYQDSGINSSHLGADEWEQDAYPGSGPEEWTAEDERENVRYRVGSIELTCRF